MRQQRARASFRSPALLVACLAVVVLSGCAFKPGYVQGEKADVPNRWKVETIEPAGLSSDQRALLEERGPPTYVRFFREVHTREPIYAWIYVGRDDAAESVWFAAGKRVEQVAVDNDPSAFRPSTRRRVRTLLLAGTGVAIVPTVILLANR